MELLDCLEYFGSQFPWDKVDIWISREPEGKIDYTAYLANNEKFGFGSVFGHGASAIEAVEDCIKKAGLRDPDARRELKIAELKEQIRKLEEFNKARGPIDV